MPMTATMAPYTLFILDDDTPMNPREDHDCLGKMVCWHSRYSLGEKHDYDEPSDFLRSLLFSEYSSGHNRNNPVFAFLKSGKAKDARLEYNRSTREWELRENQHWSSDSDWYVSSSYAASLKDEVPDWFLDDCLSALTTGELFSLVEQMDGMVILPLYLYDHSGITMNTCGFSCPWDSGQVGWIYADKAMIEQEHGKITPEILEKVRQTLEAEVKEYDYYLTNQCYGFQLFKEDVEVDSCWGFLGEIRDVQDAVKEHLPEDCNPAIVESLQFQYEELDIDEYLERLQEETEGLDWQSSMESGCRICNGWLPTITKKAIPTSMWCSGIRISEQWSLLSIQASRIKSVSSSFGIPLPSASRHIARTNSRPRNTCRPSQTK